MFSGLKRVYKSWIFIRKSNFLLNRLTLQADDPIVSEKISSHRNFQFNKFFLGVTIAVALRLIVLVISYYTAFGYLPLVRVILGCLDLGFCILWLILRTFSFKNWLTLLVPFYLTTQCILVNLSLRKLLPEVLTEFEQDTDETKILMAWFFCHCFDYNSVIVRQFQSCIVITAYYFQLKAIENHEIGVDSNSLSAKKSFCLNHMLMFVEIVVVTNVQHYFNLLEISTILLENETDISQQKKLNLFFISQPDATIIYDKDEQTKENRILLFNSAVQEMLGVCFQTDVTNNFDDILQAKIDTPIIKLQTKIENQSDSTIFLSSQEAPVYSLLQTLSNPQKVLGTSLTQIAKILNLGTETQQKYVQITVQSLIFDKKECWVLTCRDISKFEQLKKQIAENKILQQMTSSLSHEILTPLQCIVQIGNSTLSQMQDQALIENNQLIVNTAGLILRQVKCNLDRNLLDQNTFKPNLEPQSLLSIIQQTIKMLEISAAQFGIKIQIEAEQCYDNLLIDSLRIQQILINLIQNSIKFSPRDSTIMIRIKNSHTFLKHVCTTISVEDIGLGISEADLPLIFSSYFKTTDPNSMNVNQESNGLGLNISKRIAQKLGGDLTVTSQQGQGTIFYLTLNSQKSIADEINFSTPQILRMHSQSFPTKNKLQQESLQSNQSLACGSGASNQKQRQISLDQNSKLPSLSHNSQNEIQESQKSSWERNSNYSQSVISAISDADNIYGLEDDFQPKYFFQDLPEVVSSKIILAEDQPIQIQVLQEQMQELNLLSKCVICNDGQEALNSAVEIIKEALATKRSSNVKFIKPVALMLLDFQMPKLTGIQVLERIRYFCKHFYSEDVILEEPTYVFLTAYSTPQFKNHLRSLGVDHYYEKPLQLEQIRNIIIKTQPQLIFNNQNEEVSINEGQNSLKQSSSQWFGFQKS